MKGLKEFNKFIKNLSSTRKIKKLVSNAAKAVDETIKDEILDEFDSGNDPYGKKWAPRKHSYTWPVLKKTRNLRNSYRVDTRGLRTTIRNTASYSSYVHYGSKFNKARPIVPTKKRGIPKKWRKPVAKSIAKSLKKGLF